MGFPQKSSSHRTRTIGPAEKETAVERGPRPTIVVSRDDLCLMTPSSLSVRHLSSATAERPFTRAGPRVRIRFPPAESQQRTEPRLGVPDQARQGAASEMFPQPAPALSPVLQPGSATDGWFAERCFSELNPQAPFLPNWHIEVIAAKLMAVREGKIRP